MNVWRVCFFVWCSHLRYDTLAQMLTLGNIHAGSKVLVFETCAGLVLGAVMERMGGTSALRTFLWRFLSVLCKESLLSDLCVTFSFLHVQATAQWSKCTREAGPYGRVWRALASLHIFTICCMSFPSAMSTLCWQAHWTPLPKIPVLVEPAYLKD